MKKKYWLSAFFLFLIVVVVFKSSTIRYGASQAYGQLQVLYFAEPIENVLASETFPDSLKAKLRLIREIRQFAIDSLGLKNTDNYSSVFDQKGKPILWVLLASPKYELKPYEWDFPFLGKFPYKGFFNYDKLLTEKKLLTEQGFDTHIGTVSAWSTLGWFSDPILSSMLQRPEGSLANLIIHEMTHSTLFVRDNAEFNENLATFVGDRGAREFLKFKYGATSSQMDDYLGFSLDKKRLAKHMLRGMEQLDSLYATEAKSDSTRKEQVKQQAIQEIFTSADTLSFHDRSRYKWLFNIDSLPNNAYFVSFRTYQKKQNIFEDEFATAHNGNLKAYIQFLKTKYKK